YRLGLVSTGTLSHDLNRFWQTKVLRHEDPYLKVGEVNDRAHKGDSEYVWALKDINFKVEQGDVVGIIGRNGAGKSTLLKLLSRVTAPTTGTIRARGRIASLLEVGTGFHPEMTGRENIYMNGAIMGMNRAEITRKLDEIVDFSGCERYLDTPVKRYSSGMTVRLGFAIAAHLEPEILVVDEVLAVGDAEFQKKAIGKMQDVSRGEGRTVLFVSHNMGAVKNLCKRGIVLDQGQITFDGGAGEAIDFYATNSIAELNKTVIIQNKHHKTSASREIEYTKVEIENDVNGISSSETLIFDLYIKINSSDIKKAQVGVIINNDRKERVGACYTKAFPIPTDLQKFKVRMSLGNHNLAKGKYTLDFVLSQFDYSANCLDYEAVYDTISFEVKYVDKGKKNPFLVWPNTLGNCAFQNSIIDIV
ncbi:ABC transporter ATP-binding protein, partial [uncultured Fibrobacter sp.]|uniref:ABC transporter ATP-binding protein n=1 Tax=uncultured Fibrobacter sp. TaxID=261512 RepID=UPI0025CBCC4C